MTKQEYNGWTNYETWNVALWLDNEEGSSRYWRSVAEEILEGHTETGTNDEGEETKEFDTDSATSDLANRLEEEVKDGAPDLGSNCYADLLGAALSEVNWYEIAEHYIADAKESVEA